MALVEKLPMEKKKRGRGRPPTKKNTELSAIIGESTLPILINSPTKQAGHRLSEETARKGFVSTPVMKLSPSKAKTGPHSNNKSILQNITNNTAKSLLSSPNNLLKKTQNEIFSITQCDNNNINSVKKIGNNNNSYGKRFIADIISSSPVSSVGGVMTSEPNYEPSSPYNTSPLPSDNYTCIREEEAGNKRDEVDGEKDEVQDRVQESQFMQGRKFMMNNIQSSPYDEQFIKYINSSPVQALQRTPNPNSNSNSNPDPNKNNILKHRSETPKHRKIHKLNKYHSSNKLEKINLLNYRFNYQYKLTLNVNDYGKAKIFARVIEREFPEYEDYNFDNNQGGNNSNIYYNNNYDYECGYAGANDGEDYETLPPRYEQYIEKMHQQRQEMVQNCMKNDVFFTNQYYPYVNGGAHNALSMSPVRNRMSGSNSNSNWPEPVRTVNIHHIISNHPAHRGLSAGISLPALHADADEPLVLVQTQTHKKHRPPPLRSTAAAPTNDARVALRAMLGGCSDVTWAE